MAFDFKEFVDSRSPSSAAFAIEGGRATLVLDVPTDQVGPALQQLLGDTQPKGDGGLQRVLPLAHPAFPWLYCERVSSVVGMRPFKDPPSTALPDLEAPALPLYQSYELYRLTCEFTPRPYAVLSDLQVPVDPLGAYFDDTGAEIVAVFAPEHLRYTDVITDAKTELLTAQQGQMVFYRDDVPTPPLGPIFDPAEKPAFETFSGFPRIMLQSGTVLIRWYQVPERYVRSRKSHLKGWQGRVNQDDFLDWKAGELLYKGYTQKRYVPPFPSLLPLDNPDPAVVARVGTVLFSTEKLVDLELTFEETRRKIGSPATPTNPSWIAAGHNLQPYLRHRKFYYAAISSDTPSLRVPTYLSFPPELLFTDPDVA